MNIVLLLAIVGFTVADRTSDLTVDEFAASLVDVDTTLVLFYGEGCLHCAKATKEFDKAMTLLQGTDQPFALTKVNCNGISRKICRKYGIDVDSYLIYKIFRKDIMGHDYSGPQDAVAIVKYMKGRYGIASKELTTVAEVEKFVKTNEPTVIGLFEKSSTLETFFHQYADEFKGDYSFGHSSAADVLSKYKETDSIVFFRAPQFRNKFEPNSVAFKGGSRDELSLFIKKNWYGLVGHRTKDNDNDFEPPRVVAYYDVDFANNPKRSNYWRNRILPVAMDNLDYKFAVSSLEDYRSELDDFGGFQGDKPFVIAWESHKRKFKMATEFSTENLRQFMSDLKEGKLEPFIKSLPIPTPNDGPVKIAVAKNFDEIVINNGKDTFLEFFAQGTRFSEDIVDELGAKMIDEDVEIVKFDAINNDVPPNFHLQGYPDFFWLPKGSKALPVTYEEARNLEHFIKFIAKRATNELKNYDRNGEIKKSEL